MVITVNKEISSAISEIRSNFGDEFVKGFIFAYNDLGKYYLDFVFMDKTGMTHDQIATKLGIKRVTATCWINNVSIPWSVKSLLDIHKKNFHKIPKHVLARIIGWGMGDGGLDERPHYFFFCSNKSDLDKVKNFIEEKIEVKCFIKRNKTVGIITKHDGSVRRFSGDNWIIRISDTSFARFLYASGLPKGRKTNQEFSVPRWILDADKQVKREFISALFESELERFRLEKRNTKIMINASIFGMCKNEKYISNLENFLNQIRSILKEDFEIETSSLSIPQKANLNIAGNFTYFIRFSIRSYAENILRLSENMDFRFNRDKQETLEIASVEARNKIKGKMDQLEKYNKSQILFKEGYNFSQIAKELGITHPTAKEWVVTRKHLPEYVSNQKIKKNNKKVDATCA